jgi:hypothetical protein
VWTLPLDAITPGAPAYLGLYPSSPDGVDYVTHTGAVPPVIEVDFVP